MKISVAIGLAVATAAAPGLAAAGWPDPGEDGPVVEVIGGTVKFDVATNVPAVTVHGESKALRGRVRVVEGSQGVVLDQLEATIPVESLKTGVSLRDEHMRKYVFTTPSGQLPDLRFAAQSSKCSPGAARGETTCRVSGNLTIRGTARPFAIVLTVSEEGSAFRATGDGLVKLSAYQIARPSQLLVTTGDEVRLRLELTGKASGGKVTTRLRGTR